MRFYFSCTQYFVPSLVISFRSTVACCVPRDEFKFQIFNIDFFQVFIMNLSVEMNEETSFCYRLIHDNIPFKPFNFFWYLHIKCVHWERNIWKHLITFFLSHSPPIWLHNLASSQILFDVLWVLKFHVIKSSPNWTFLFFIWGRWCI